MKPRRPKWDVHPSYSYDYTSPCYPHDCGRRLGLPDVHPRRRLRSRHFGVHRPEGSWQIDSRSATCVLRLRQKCAMTTACNLRAVQTLRRAQSIRHASWRWAPPVVWLLLADSVALIMVALLCSLRTSPVARDFVAPDRCLDVLVGCAGLLASVAMFILCAHRFQSRKSKERGALKVSSIGSAAALSPLSSTGFSWKQTAIAHDRTVQIFGVTAGRRAGCHLGPGQVFALSSGQLEPQM